MKKELGLALASFGLFLGVIASSAQASIIQWDLVNVTATRSPYETVTGFFDVNSNTGKVTDFSLTVSGLPGGYLPFTFNPVATNFATQQGDGYNGLYYSSPYPNPSQLNYYGFGARTPYRIGVGIVDGGIHLTTSASEGAGYPFNSIFTEYSSSPLQLVAGSGFDLSSNGGTFAGDNLVGSLSSSVVYPISATPLPASLPMFSVTLLGMYGFMRFRKRGSRALLRAV